MMRRWHNGNRYVFWPVYLRWGKTSSKPLTWHWWQKGFESCDPDKWGEGCIPGKRRVMAQVLHFWRLKVCFG